MPHALRPHDPRLNAARSEHKTADPLCGYPLMIESAELADCSLKSPEVPASGLLLPSIAEHPLRAHVDMRVYSQR